MTNAATAGAHLCAPQTTVASRDRQQTPQHPRSRVLHISLTQILPTTFSHKISGMQLMLQNYSESNACASFSQHKRQRRDKTRRIRMKTRPQKERQPIGEQASPEDLRLEHEAARTVSRHFGCQKSSSPAPPAPATPSQPSPAVTAVSGADLRQARLSPAQCEDAE